MEHWRYFLALEDDLAKTFRYVEPVPGNYGTYSIEFARLILTACSEVDAVSKMLCQRVEPESKADNMDGYRSVLFKAYPGLTGLKVLLPHYSSALEPWKEWVLDVNPGWWKDHQKVKHARHESFHLANFDHAVASLGGLYCLVLYLYHVEYRKNQLRPKPSLFALEGEAGYLIAGKNTLPDFR